MKAQLTIPFLFLGVCALTSARSNNFFTTGDFFHRLTSHWQDGELPQDDATQLCANKGQVLPQVTSQRELDQLLRELTEMFWVPDLLKSCIAFEGVEIWTQHKVNFIDAQPLPLFSDFDENGQYCAALVAVRGHATDLQGAFQIEGRDCSGNLTTVCVRNDLFRKIVVGPTGLDQFNGTQSEVEDKCQAAGMELYDVTLDSDFENLAAELNRLGYPRNGEPGPHTFYFKNKIGGTPGDNATFPFTVGTNCLAMKNRAAPNEEEYDMVVSDCSEVGRAACAAVPPEQGKFYNELTIAHISGPISKVNAKKICKNDFGGKKLPLIKTRQDLYDLSAELVRLGLFEVTSYNTHPWTVFWLDNPTTSSEKELQFDDLTLKRRGGDYCVKVSNKYSYTGLEVFRPEGDDCNDLGGFAVCTLKTVRG